MNRNFYKPAIGLMWLALPITALSYWRAWDQLPLRMAVHFDTNWRPNGYTTREESVMLGLGIMTPHACPGVHRRRLDGVRPSSRLRRYDTRDFCLSYSVSFCGSETIRLSSGI